LPTKSGKVIQVGWKDNTLVLNMFIILDTKDSVNRNRKKPSAIFILAKTTRAPFGRNEYIKSISILLFFDLYNYNMNTIDRGDQFVIINLGLWYYVRGGWQAVEY
jgi:hypothetical protein